MAEYNESQINSNETERISAEQQRINNEAQRQTKETEREAREATRQSNESTRISKEAERLAAEVNRQEAEASRVAAENNRGIRLTELENEVNALGTELRETDAEIQNDMTYARALASTVTDAYKFTVDYNEMMPSLLTLNDIIGSSEIKINNLNERKIVNTKIKSICTVNTNSKNYFEDMIWLGSYHGAEYTRDGNDITVSRLEIYQDNPTAYAFISLDIPNLTDGKKYCLFCDEVIINDGASAIELHSGGGAEYDTGQTLNGRDIDVSSFNKIFTYSANRFDFRLHCTVGSQTGNVTFKNMQIYEIKEMIVPDIQLNSVPNGVKDEIKDGMLIKRTNQVNLKDLKWVVSSTNAGANDYKVYYTHDLTDIKWPTDREVNPNTILCNMLPCTSNAGTGGANDSLTQYQTPGISSHAERSELRIKVKASDAPDLNSLYAWLNNNNVTAVYEMQSYKYEGVNLTIKADKGDTVVINTTKTMDLTYDIQLNTRAQIDALQEQSQAQQSNIFMLHNNISEIQNDVKTGMSWTTDIKQDAPVDQNYYILPGGLMIQYGRIVFPANTINTTHDFNIQLQKACHAYNSVFLCSLSGADNSWDGVCYGHFISSEHVRVVLKGINSAVINTVFWIALSATN